MSERMEEFAGDFPPVDEESWRERVSADLKGAGFRRRLVTETPEGIAVEPLYGPESDPGPDPWGLPESFPYLRGAPCPQDPLHCWDVCVEIHQADLGAARDAVRRAVSGGATALRLVLGGGVRHGRDADSVTAGVGEGEGGSPEGHGALDFEAGGSGGVPPGSAEELDEPLRDVDLLDAGGSGGVPPGSAEEVDEPLRDVDLLDAGGSGGVPPCSAKEHDEPLRDVDLLDAGGSGGVLLSTAEELDELLAEVDLSRVAVMIDGAGGGFAAAAALVQVARRRGIDAGSLRGSLGDDPLAQIAESGLLPGGLSARWRTMTEQAAWCIRRAPGLRAAQVSTLPYREAGANAALELAYALATGVEYLRLMTLAGLSVGEAARQISFLSGVGRDLFMEIAKLRALRGCWARIVEASGGGTDLGSGVEAGGGFASSRGGDASGGGTDLGSGVEVGGGFSSSRGGDASGVGVAAGGGRGVDRRDGKSGEGAAESAAAARIHLRSLLRRRTRRDPWVNILRGTVETVVAASGGADAVTVLPFDGAIGPSDELAERLARNTQVIAQEESHLGWVRDPAGGSWYVESLTRQLAERAWDHFQRIEAAGGMARHLLEGRVAEEVRANAAAAREAVSKGSAPVTGVSSYPLLDEEAVVREPEECERLRLQAAARLRAHRKRFDQAAAVAELERIARRKEPAAAAGSDGGVVPEKSETAAAAAGGDGGMVPEKSETAAAAAGSDGGVVPEKSERAAAAAGGDGEVVPEKSETAAAADRARERNEPGATDHDDSGMPGDSPAAAKQTTGGRPVESADGSLLEAAIAAAGAGASFGAIHGVLDRGQAAVHLEPLLPEREAAGFEALRDASDAHLQRTGSRPRVFLAALGSIATDKARTAFARRLLASGGIEADSPTGGDAVDAAAPAGSTTVEAAISAYREAPSPVAVICGSDESYAELLPGLARALHDAGARLVLLTARPGKQEAALRRGGIDGLLHAGCHAVDLLELIQAELEVTP